MNDTWEYDDFTIEEMQCKGFAKGLCTCGGVLPRDSFMKLLQKARILAGFPFPISSGGRCKDYNKIIGSTSVAHTLGAADIKVFGERAYALVRIACELKFPGIGVHQKTTTPSNQRYIHLDNLTSFEGAPRPRIWSY